MTVPPLGLVFPRSTGRRPIREVGSRLIFPATGSPGRVEYPGGRAAGAQRWKEHALMSPTSLARSRAEQALRHSALPALRKLAVEETDAEVFITGSVSSYYLKQLAQETVM